MDTQQTAQVYSADIRLLEKRRTTLLSEVDRLRRLHATTKREVDELQRQKVSLIHTSQGEAQGLKTAVRLTDTVKKEMDEFATQTTADVGAKTQGRITRLVAREKAASANTAALALRDEALTKKEQDIEQRANKAGEKLAAAIIRQQEVDKRERDIQEAEKVAGNKLREANTNMQSAATQEKALREDIVVLGKSKGKLQAAITTLQQELKDKTAAMRRSALALVTREEAITKKETDHIARERKLVDREDKLMRTVKRLREKGYTGVI